MKLQPEDPRLTAFLLGELSAGESAAVERAVAADPALQIALRELEAVQILLTGTLAAKPQTLLPRQRSHILLAAKQADLSDEPVLLPSHRASLRPLLIPLAAAAVIAAGIYTLLLIPSPEIRGTDRMPDDDAATVPMEIALLPAPGPADASTPDRQTAPASDHDGAAATSRLMDRADDDFIESIQRRLAAEPPPADDRLPALRARGSVSAAHHPTLALPIRSGRASLGWITHHIREERRLPPANAVRAEEILNHFSIRPVGPTAVSQGVTLSTETIPCPWKPSATLAIISIRGSANEARRITASYQADAAAVWRYRLLGYAAAGGAPPAKLPSRLPAGALTTIALEIEPSSSGRDFGFIEWVVDGQPAAPVPLTRRNDHEPSDDARFAALLCCFSQWLAAEPAGLVDADMLAALAREIASHALPRDRTDLLNLIDQALRLER